MLDKCPLCGTGIWNLASSEVCPKCGTNLTSASPATALTPSALRLPQRKNTSRADEIKLQRANLSHNYGVEGSIFMTGSWDEVLEDRQLDVPLYTAPLGRATVAVLFSTQAFPPSTLDDLAESRHPFGLHVRAFVGDGYPILRVNLFLPDNPDEPYCLESPLDIRDGDVQDFIEAAVRSESFDLVMAHEAAQASVKVARLKAPGLAALLQDEVAKTVVALPPTPSSADFKAASERMERVFPGATDGIDRTRMIRGFVDPHAASDDDDSAGTWPLPAGSSAASAASPAKWLTGAELSSSLDALIEQHLSRHTALISKARLDAISQFWESHRAKAIEKILLSMGDGLRHSFSVGADALECHFTSLSCRLEEIPSQYQRVRYGAYLERTVQAVIRRRGAQVDLAHLQVCSAYRLPKSAVIPGSQLPVRSDFDCGVYLSFVPADRRGTLVIPSELQSLLS